MEPKKIILCPNPDRDTGMKATKSAIAILRDMGFQTVVCSPFRDPKTNGFSHRRTNDAGRFRFAGRQADLYEYGPE